MTKRKAAWRRYFDVLDSDEKVLAMEPEPKRSRQRDNNSDRFARAINRAAKLKAERDAKDAA